MQQGLWHYIWDRCTEDLCTVQAEAMMNGKYPAATVVLVEWLQ